jgi:hypothetical protein
MEADEMQAWIKEIGPIPPQTCPKIDKTIGKMRSLERDARNLEKYAEKGSDMKWFTSDVQDVLSAVESDLEEIRKDNEQLRELGKFWYEKAKDLHEELMREENQVAVKKAVAGHNK